MITSDTTIYDDLAAHAIDCRHPREACILCRARAEMEARAGDVEAIRIARDDASSRVATMHTLLQRTLPQVMDAADRLVRAELGGGPVLPWAGAPRAADDTELRTARALLAEARDRLYRVRSAHARHSARAVMTEGEEAAVSRAVAGELARAWHGDGWDGDPLASLEIHPREVCGA